MYLGDPNKAKECLLFFSFEKMKSRYLLHNSVLSVCETPEQAQLIIVTNLER
jgi:hypothetical protein